MANQLAKHLTAYMWILIVMQLLEAIHYLHEEAKVLHNDIKCNNVLVAQSLASTNEGTGGNCYQAVLIHLGKRLKFWKAKDTISVVLKSLNICENIHISHQR